METSEGSILILAFVCKAKAGCIVSNRIGKTAIIAGRHILVPSLISDQNVRADKKIEEHFAPDDKHNDGHKYL